MHRLPGCRDGPLRIRLVVGVKEKGRRSMTGPYDAEQAGETQQPGWHGTSEHQTGEQQFTEQSGNTAPGGYISWHEQHVPPGLYGAYGGGDQAQQGWGYGEQPGGSGAGWGYAPGYAPGYVPPPAPRSTSRPLPGAPEQMAQDTQDWTGGYAGGYYGPPSQSLQPFQPAQPPYGSYGSYGSYGPASGGQGAYGGYGTYGPASGYGGYGGYGSYGPASQYGGDGGYGQPSQWSPPFAIEEPARPPWSLRRKLIVFGGLVALLLVLASGGLGYMQYNAPAAAANRICDDFRSQRYVDMYGLFDAHLQAGMTSVQFAQAVLDLDRAEGQTVKCEAVVHANGFSDSSTTATIVLTRPNADGLQGAARLKNEGGTWKVAALDQSLFGVDLRALNSVESYCTALLGQTYDAAYGMLDKGQQSKQKVADFRREAGWRDEVDGNATACRAAAIGANTNNTASMTLSVTRSRAGEHTGTIALVVEDGAWKIHSVADEALGSDIGPVRTGTRFCNDLASGNYTDITTLFLGLIPNVGEVASLFSGAYNGIKWTGCTLDLSTYKLSGSSASLIATFTVMRLSDGNTGSGPIKVEFTKAGHDWKISNLTDPNK